MYVGPTHGVTLPKGFWIILPLARNDLLNTARRVLRSERAGRKVPRPAPPSKSESPDGVETSRKIAEGSQPCFLGARGGRSRLLRSLLAAFSMLIRNLLRSSKRFRNACSANFTLTHSPAPMFMSDPG